MEESPRDAFPEQLKKLGETMRIVAVIMFMTALPPGDGGLLWVGATVSLMIAVASFALVRKHNGEKTSITSVLLEAAYFVVLVAGGWCLERVLDGNHNYWLGVGFCAFVVLVLLAIEGAIFDE